jgi:hypothetical protein
VLGARAFVNWYNGHPDYARDPELCRQIEAALTGAGERRVVVLGQGNVALDCARILAKCDAELKSTDICDHALQVRPARATRHASYAKAADCRVAARPLPGRC